MSRGTPDNKDERRAIYRRSHFADIGELLRERRKKLNLTLQEVAERCNVTHSTVSRWETGFALPNTVEALQTLASVYELSEEETKKLSQYALGRPDMLYSAVNTLVISKIDALGNIQPQVKLTDIVVSIRRDGLIGECWVTQFFRMRIFSEQNQSENLGVMMSVPREDIELPSATLIMKNNEGIIVGDGPQRELLSELNNRLSAIQSLLTNPWFGGIKMTFDNGTQIAAYSTPGFQTDDNYDRYHLDLLNQKRYLMPNSMQTAIEIAAVISLVDRGSSYPSDHVNFLSILDSRKFTSIRDFILS